MQLPAAGEEQAPGSNPHPKAPQSINRTVSLEIQAGHLSKHMLPWAHSLEGG